MGPVILAPRALRKNWSVMSPKRLDYQIVRYEPPLKPAVLELQTNLWSSSLALNGAYFDWKYQRNPYLKEPLIYLALSGGRPVGMRGFFGTRWEGGMVTSGITLLYADDMVIAPDHRGKGLMSSIMNSAFRDLSTGNFSHALNLSAGLVTLRSSLSMGWQSAGWAHPIRRRSWPATLQRCLSIVEKRRARMPNQMRAALAGARNKLHDLGADRIGRFLRNNPDVSLERAPRCGEMADLVARIGPTERIRHVRDGEYYGWRFQNPLSHYRFLFWGRGRLEGYLVLQEYTSDLVDRERLNIVDWEGSNPAILLSLLRAACVVAHDRPLWIWVATLPAEVISMLKRRGFRTVEAPPSEPSPPAVLVRPLREDQCDGRWRFGHQSLLDLANWDLRMLYSMHG